MYTSETQIRVCYGDTDMMGVVYYGTYPRYYEISRTEWLRARGITYREIEEAGVAWPIRSLNIHYLKPAYYDDLLTLRTIVKELPLVKFNIRTEIYNPQNELINYGDVVLVSTDKNTGKVIKTPEWLLERFREMNLR